MALRERIAECKFLDVSYNIYASKSVDEWENNKQPARRTQAVVDELAREFKSDLPEGEEEGDGEIVISQYSYPIAGCPKNLWMSRPIRKFEYAQCVKV